MLEKRGPFREGHLGTAAKFKKSGDLVMGGAYADPVYVFFFVHFTPSLFVHYIPNNNNNITFKSEQRWCARRV